jgi:hypothetical protein
LFRRPPMNRLLNTAATILVLLLAVTASTQVSAQDTGDQGQGAAAPAATGPDTGTQTIENPPLSGLDAPSFEPGFGARSYLVPKIQVSEAVDSNPVGSVGSQTVVKDVTRGLGSLTLQKLWKIHPLDVNYVGGAAYYPSQGGNVYQLQSLAAIQRILWRTGQLAIRDGFSYLPQGSFGFNSYGGAGAFGGGGGLGNLGGGLPGGGVVGGGGGGTLGTTQFGSLGNQPRITNNSVIDVTQAFSPRSSIVMAGGYGLADFINNPQGYINSEQITGQLGYNYQLSRKDQIAVSYAFQEFHFPQAGKGNFNANVWQVMYGHRISGKLDFLAGGGPQWIHINNGTTTNSYISGAGRMTLTYYHSLRTNLTFLYSHYTNPGSGFFAGANTDSTTLSLMHMLSRRWSMTTDTGFSYSSRVIKSPTSTANNASSYTYWYAGGALRYQIARHFGAFANYQYDAMNFASGFCKTGNCSRSTGRNVGLIGLDWTPSPIRLE